ncbi:helicase-related protein [Vibrio owensii]|uniref:helicase-related protein n=1 Tax=Vibrio owensii TaxID=696485 RepID=UPI004068EBDC
MSIENDLKIEPWQCLLKVPQSYEDYRYPVRYVSNAMSGQNIVFQGRLGNVCFTGIRGAPAITGDLFDGNNQPVRFSVFSKAESELAKWLVSNQQQAVTITAMVKLSHGRIYLQNLKPVPNELQGRLVSFYKLTKKNQLRFQTHLLHNFNKLLASTVSHIRAQMGRLDYPPAQLRQIIEAKGVTLEDTLQNLHFPAQPEQGHKAKAILERLMCLLILSQSHEPPEKLIAPCYVRKQFLRHVGNIPFSLSEEQRNATTGLLESIIAREPKSILLGDVGTGKTVVGALVAKSVVAAGGRVGIMVPNLILGAQIYQEIDQYFPDISIEFLLSKSERKNFEAAGYRTISELSDASSIVIGTTALIHNHNDIELDLLWIDEEQRVGLEHKEKALITPGRTHLLLSSATCIPRTQAMMEFGLVPYYCLTKYHNDREVITTLYEHTDMSLVAERVESVIQNGGKVLVVCTQKEESIRKNPNQPERLNAHDLYHDWSATYGDKVVISHGGLSKSENEIALNAIKNGPAQLLIATTLIEVGITIPGLMYVCVVNPENLGVVSLHQIRGRVARKGGTGYCDLLPTRAIKEDTRVRLELMLKHSDGFSLAEADMRMRGIGDIAGGGNNQSGVTHGLLLDCQLDIDILNHIMEKMSTKQYASTTGL